MSFVSFSVQGIKSLKKNRRILTKIAAIVNPGMTVKQGGGGHCGAAPCQCAVLFDETAAVMNHGRHSATPGSLIS